MIYHDVKQGTPEWLRLRAGIPTASDFDRLLTPTGKISTQAESYMCALLAERIMGHPRKEFISMWMERGSELEKDAAIFYELQRDCETVPIGFITNDEGTVGASPDRLVGDTGLLEIKCPAEHTHVRYLIYGAVEQHYYPQIQGQLWVTGREWVDMLSFHPEMPPALIRVQRDEKYIEKLSAVVTAFSVELERHFALLNERGIVAQHREVQQSSLGGWPSVSPLPSLEELLTSARRNLGETRL